MLRSSAVMMVVLVLPACDLIAGVMHTRPQPADPSEAMHDVAMADFSMCQTASDPAVRAAAAARLSAAAAEMDAMARPQNPDHFFMMDRVVSAAEFCAAAQ